MIAAEVHDGIHHIHGRIVLIVGDALRKSLAGDDGKERRNLRPFEDYAPLPQVKDMACDILIPARFIIPILPTCLADLFIPKGRIMAFRDIGMRPLDKLLLR